MLRNHWPFFIIVPFLIIVMTWPTTAYILDPNTLWLPNDVLDLGMKFWDAWYGERILAGKADFYFTDLLFHPEGLSLVFHNFSVPHMLLMQVVQKLLPPTNAYSLCYLLIIFVNAASSYLYIFYLLRDRWLAMYGSVLFGLSVFVIEHAVQPDANSVAVFPLVMYCMQRGFNERRARWMIPAGVITGLTAFTGMYIFVCLLITIGIFTLFNLPKRWKARKFWVSLALLLALAGSISALRIVPMMSAGAGLDEALGKGGGREYGSDLLDSFVHRDNVVSELVFAPLLQEPEPPFREDGYIGYVALLLAGIGLVKTKPRRRTLIWFLLFLVFFVLKLGPALTVNGHTFDDIVLPKAHLNSMIPVVFEAFWITAYFHIGLLLPLAILSAFGLRHLLAAFPAKSHRFIVIICLVLTFFETIEPPDSYTVPSSQLDYMDWLRLEDRQEEIRLINVPFGRGPSKRYALFQIFNGYPHAEGLASRTPAAAYDYIRANLILDTWNSEEGILCLPFNESAFIHALDQLLGDGFSHIVFHNDIIRLVKFANYSFISIQPAFENEYARVYRLGELRNICDENAFFSPGVLPQLASLMSPSTPPAGRNDASASAAAEMPPVALPVAADGIVLGAPITLAGDFDAAQLLPDKGIVLLVYYPPHTGADQAEAAASRLAKTLKSCGRAGRAGAAYIEYFTWAAIPCALLIADDPLAVSYENGVFLANAVLSVDGDRLELETVLLWNKLPEAAHGVSIQLFDQAGGKVAGSDFTIHHDALSRHRLDLSSLDDGDYALKLILYNYATGVSVPGIALSSQARFGRELDVGPISID